MSLSLNPDHTNFKMGSFAKNGQELPEIIHFEYCVKVVFFRQVNGRILSKTWDKSGKSAEESGGTQISKKNQYLGNEFR